METDIGMTPGEDVASSVAQSGGAGEIEEGKGYEYDEYEKRKAICNNKPCETF
jgi:hypothetical protein